MIRLRVWANTRPMGWFGHAGTKVDPRFKAAKQFKQDTVIKTGIT